MPLPFRAHALLAAAAAFSLAGAAQATTLADNTSLATEGTLTVAGDDWLAASFVASEAVSSAQTLLAALVGMTTTGSAALTLYSSDPSGLIPADALATFTAGSSQGLGYTLTGTALAAGSTYWLVLANTGGSSTWGWTADGSGSGAGFTAAWAASDDAGSTWFAQSTLYPLQASVGVSAVPEPATVLLWLAGAAVLTAARTARRRDMF